MGGVPVVRVAVQQDQVGAEARRGPDEVRQQHRIGAVDAQARLAEPGVQLERQARGDGDPQQVPQQYGVGQLAADPAARPASGRPRPRTSPGPGGSGASARPCRTPATEVKATAFAAAAVHRLGEVGEEGLDGAGGVGDLFGEEFQAHDLAGLGGAGGGQLARAR